MTKEKDSPYLTKLHPVHGITLYSIDGTTWSNNPDELVPIQERKEKGLVGTIDKRMIPPRRKPIARTEEDEPLEVIPSLEDDELDDDDTDVAADADGDDEDDGDEDVVAPSGKGARARRIGDALRSIGDELGEVEEEDDDDKVVPAAPRMTAIAASIPTATPQASGKNPKKADLAESKAEKLQRKHGAEKPTAPVSIPPTKEKKSSVVAVAPRSVSNKVRKAPERSGDPKGSTAAQSVAAKQGKKRAEKNGSIKVVPAKQTTKGTKKIEETSKKKTSLPKPKSSSADAKKTPLAASKSRTATKQVQKVASKKGVTPKGKAAKPAKTLSSPTKASKGSRKASGKKQSAAIPTTKKPSASSRRTKRK